MGLDHSNAFVRLRFDGLIASCFNKRERNRCELGMVPEEEHKRLLKVIRIKPDSSEVEEKKFDLNDENKVIIEALAPAAPGAIGWEGGHFDRRQDQGDPEDFRWVMDLQGDEFHGKELKLKRDEDSLLRPRIIVPHGIFYTYQKTPDIYLRLPRKGDTDEKILGKIADKIGADIVCDSEEGVRVKISGLETFTLKEDVRGTRFYIDVTNLCGTDKAGVTLCTKSDFRHYYKAAKDNDGIEFDLRTLFVQGDPRGKEPASQFIAKLTGRRAARELDAFNVNGPPEVCSGTTLSDTNKLP